MEVKAKGSTNKGQDWQPIAVDADGHVQGDIKSLPGAGLIRKFISSFHAEVEDAKSGAGEDSCVHTVVPAGECWIITACSAYCNSAALDHIRLDVNIAGVNYPIKCRATVPQYETCDIQGVIVLEAGARIRGGFWGGAAGNVIRLQVHGYKITIP